jgi:hypothetical protein
MCFKTSTFTLLLLLLVLVALSSSADIYRCRAADGLWVFTDRGCTDGMGEQLESSAQLTNQTLKGAGLSEAERQALTNLDKRLAKSRAARLKERKKVSRRVRKDRKIRQKSCTLASLQIAEMQNQKSHGYKLTDAHKLDQQNRNLQAIKKANCS